MLHAHIESATSDCDGMISRDYILEMNDDEIASDFGDIEFHNRVVGNVVNTYSILWQGELKVNRFEDGSVRISWSEPTDEGGIHTEATFCEDECELNASSYRDHRAEEYGY